MNYKNHGMGDCDRPECMVAGCITFKKKIAFKRARDEVIKKAKAWECAYSQNESEALYRDARLDLADAVAALYRLENPMIVPNNWCLLKLGEKLMKGDLAWTWDSPDCINLGWIPITTNGVIDSGHVPVIRKIE